MKRLLLIAALLCVGADNPLPYRIWWSFPNDDDTAIEVDDPDLSTSSWSTRWSFAVAMQKCDARKSKKLAQHKDGTPVREIRVESLEADGKARATNRCVMTLKDWRARIGKPLVERLEDELDAHSAFLMPRHYPGGPQPDAGTPESQADARKVQAPKADARKADPRKVDASKAEAPSSDGPKADPPNADTPKAQPPKSKPAEAAP